MNEQIEICRNRTTVKGQQMGHSVEERGNDCICGVVHPELW